MILTLDMALGEFFAKDALFKESLAEGGKGSGGRATGFDRRGRVAMRVAISDGYRAWLWAARRRVFTLAGRSLVGPERNHLQGKGGSPSAVFRRFWQTTPPKSWGIDSLGQRQVLGGGRARRRTYSNPSETRWDASTSGRQRGRT